MSEIAERYGTVADGFHARLVGIGPEQWSDITPCEDWTVRDLVAHVIGTHRSVVSTLGSAEPAEVDKNGDLLEAFEGARDAVDAALADPAKSAQTISGMFGEQPFESLVGRLLTSDTLIHTWDLARATSQDERLDGRAVQKTTEFLSPLDEAIRRPGGFAPKITPPPDADPQRALLNFAGRVV